jgi:TPR repeat protein
VVGCLRFGALYENGDVGDVDKALSAYRQACDAGSAPGCFNLGRLYLRGAVVPRDPAQAAALFKKSCTGGGAAACYELGLLYDAGPALERERAMPFFKQACGLGDQRGCQKVKRASRQE